MKKATVLFALAFWSSACIQAGWTRETRDKPVPAEALVELGPGAGLDACLARLGAPLHVQEVAVDGAQGAMLVYGWYESRGWGVDVSVPLQERASASVSYDQGTERMRGVALVFDADLLLDHWRDGLVRDLLGEGQRVRPQPVDG